jgi:phosphohistidine phosphatase
MKTLYLVRHAKAGWDNSWTADFDRSLSDHGRKEAKEIARRLHGKDAIPELIVSSPARRALGTAEIIAGVLGYPLEDILQKIEIYEGGPDALASIVRSLPESCQTVMLFGHNPTISLFSSWLTGEAHRQMETCSVVKIDFSEERWADINAGSGRSAWYDYPKEN